MKKIMFNDQYGLTQAVLANKKTMTRCIAYTGSMSHELHIGHDNTGHVILCDGWEKVAVSRYAVGDEIAIAQSYHELNKRGFIAPSWCEFSCEDSPGYKNKRFVRADLMPHRIRITDIQLQRLQDISEEECLKEGLLAGEQEPKMYGFKLPKGIVLSFMTPREAFAALIDRISGKGTWESNPWVYAYTFDLVL